jgi:hypothetical protein
VTESKNASSRNQVAPGAAVLANDADVSTAVRHFARQLFLPEYPQRQCLWALSVAWNRMRGEGLNEFELMDVVDLELDLLRADEAP